MDTSTINFTESNIAKLQDSLQRIERRQQELDTMLNNQLQEHITILRQLSQEHLHSITVANDEFNKLAKKTFDRLDRASIYTIKGISEAVSSFRLSDFQKLTEQSCDIVEETSNKAISHVHDSVKNLHWKNFGLALAVTIFATVTMGLYISDEMPWEMHKQVVAQRQAGETLLNAWHSLSDNERLHILQHSTKNISNTDQA